MSSEKHLSRGRGSLGRRGRMGVGPGRHPGEMTMRMTMMVMTMMMTMTMMVWAKQRGNVLAGNAPRILAAMINFVRYVRPD